MLISYRPIFEDTLKSARVYKSTLYMILGALYNELNNIYSHTVPQVRIHTKHLKDIQTNMCRQQPIRNTTIVNQQLYYILLNIVSFIHNFTIIILIIRFIFNKRGCSQHGTLTRRFNRWGTQICCFSFEFISLMVTTTVCKLNKHIHKYINHQETHCK